MLDRMPEYKLHYFNLRGRAEIARLILHQAGVEFEDVRYDRVNEWPAIKASNKYNIVTLGGCLHTYRYCCLNRNAFRASPRARGGRPNAGPVTLDRQVLGQETRPGRQGRMGRGPG